MKTKSSIEDLFASTAVGNFQEHVATFGIKVDPPQDTWDQHEKGEGFPKQRQHEHHAMRASDLEVDRALPTI